MRKNILNYYNSIPRFYVNFNIWQNNWQIKEKILIYNVVENSNLKEMRFMENSDNGQLKPVPSMNTYVSSFIYF